jgi:hypothetical protein
VEELLLHLRVWRYHRHGCCGHRTHPPRKPGCPKHVAPAAAAASAPEAAPAAQSKAESPPGDGIHGSRCAESGAEAGSPARHGTRSGRPSSVSKRHFFDPRYYGDCFRFTYWVAFHGPNLGRGPARVSGPGRLRAPHLGLAPLVGRDCPRLDHGTARGPCPSADPCTEARFRLEMAS